LTATPARHAALRTLSAIGEGVLADHALETEAHDLSRRDRAWTQELVYGTLRLQGRLDHILSQIARGEIDAHVRNILRLGVYQLLEMRSVPSYAAVSESVELAKPVRKRAAGYVNGVLQKLVRERERIVFPNFDADPIAWLTTWGSHPEWLVRRWIGAYGIPATRDIVEADNQRPPLYVHTLGAFDDAAAALTGAGITFESVPGVPESMRLVDAIPHEALAAARLIVQDPAASLVTRYFSVDAGMLVADLCAAPGGKTAALATSSPAPAYILAGDVAPVRARRVAATVHRLGLSSVGVVTADARRPPVESVDAVLLDAPCTGTGTLRRHPDARWRVKEEHLATLVPLQAELIDAAARIVRPDGVLVYATCSLEAEENEAQVTAFLARHGEFRTEVSGSVDARFLDANGWLRVLPHVHGFDGVFAARLRRG
jgi:16S rRNA (cytosine967-C5)-methyltransferase